jgi:hypothetical protein
VKIAHRNPASKWFTAPESDPVDEDYEAKVQQSTDRGERECRQARERLSRAEKRLARAQAQKATAVGRRRMAQLREVVGERRAEVDRLARLMASPTTADKQIRLRTGLDDHLDLGEHKPQAPRRVPPGPVTTTYGRRKSDG